MTLPQARDFDIGVARRLAELERQLAYLRSIVINPGLSDGTFTPTYFGTTGAGTFTYSNQVGVYRTIGNLVYISARITITAIPVAPTGNMRMGGLPFTSNTTYNHSIYFSRISNFNYTAAAFQLTGIILASGTVIQLEESFDSIASVPAPAANFANVACDMIFSGWYLKA